MNFETTSKQTLSWMVDMRKAVVKPTSRQQNILSLLVLIGLASLVGGCAGASAISIASLMGSPALPMAAAGISKTPFACRGQSQIDRGVEIQSSFREPVHDVFLITSGLECTGDNKQSDEQHQNRPLHQPEQILGAKFGAGQVNAGSRQHDDFFRNGREEQADNHDEN